MKTTFVYLRTMESATLHGQAVARELLKLRKQGFKPDAVLAQPGWGESLHVKDVFPDARLVHYGFTEKGPRRMTSHVEHR